MAPRPHWKGYLKLSLVTCPVEMMPATSGSEKVRFHTLNRETGNRIQSRFVDVETGQAVDADHQVKGYETEPDRYVMLEDEELEAVALESTRIIDIEQFVERQSIPWIYLDSPYYLTPGDEVGEEAFSVIRDAMAGAKMVGISRLVMGRRERAVMLEPRDRGIVLWSLRYGDEVRDAAGYFEDIDQGKPDTDLMTLARKLVRERTKDWSPDMVKDPVQEHLLKLIASKKGRKVRSKGGKAERGGNVVNLFEALKKSLADDASSSGRAK